MLVVAGTSGGRIHGFGVGADLGSPLVPVFVHTVSSAPNSTTEWTLAHPTAPILYVVDNPADPALGRIIAYRVSRSQSWSGSQSWSLSTVSAVSSAGRGPCFMALDNLTDPQWLLVANYRQGTGAAIRVNPDGSLAPTVASTTDAPPGHAPFPTPGFQDQSYAHCFRIDPYTRRYALLVDAGLNQLRHYSFNRTSGELRTIGATNTSVWRPRHFEWHPALPIAYVVHELSSIISAWAFDTATGLVSEQPLQHAPTRAPTFFTGFNLPAEIAISADATRLLVTNRGADTVAAYSISGDGNLAADSISAERGGLLTPLGFADAGGGSPRHLAWLPRANSTRGAKSAADDGPGDVGLLSNEATSSISTFRVDGGGHLRLLANTSGVPLVACTAIVRVPLEPPSQPWRGLAASVRPPQCSGLSANLSTDDCASWRTFALNPAYSTWLQAKCVSASASPVAWRDDPCSCVFRSESYGESQVGCTRSAAATDDASSNASSNASSKGSRQGVLRVTELKLNAQALPAAGGVPKALLGLRALSELSLASNGLQGTIPAALYSWLPSLRRLGLGANRLSGTIPTNLARLTSLDRLGLDHNQLAGIVPSELGVLGALKLLTVDSNPHLRGRLPPLPFEQYTECCRLFNVSFECPLPGGANSSCIGGNLCGGYPAPACVG